MHPFSAVATGLGGGAVAGAALLGYAMWEARQYTLCEVSVPVLPRPGSIRVLHLSDLHLTGRNADRVRWVAGLDALQPDLVVVTGDFLSAEAGISAVQEALAELVEVPGVFVLGSNDFYAAKPINPAKYLRGPSRKPSRHTQLDTPRLLSFLTSGSGDWRSLNNDRAQLRVNGFDLAFAGTGDAHHRMDVYEAVAGQWPAGADLRIGVTHAPYLRVLDAMAADGVDLMFAGHTHGGQVCRPNGVAWVTNCDLEPARAKGLSRHDEAWLHVSAGLGTNPYSPIRLACRPEATLLTLVERPS